MPYIAPSARQNLIDGGPIDTSGKLAYSITTVLNSFLAQSEGNTFLNFAIVLGALEAAKLEFYRRVVVPFENQKHEENGDVY
jgi:hypothetical protein